MKEKINTISAAVKEVIDNYPIGHEFYGNEFKDDCVKLVPEAMESYVDTFLKMARRHRRDSYISIDHNNSLYKRVKSNYEIEQEKIERERAEELARIEEEKQSRKTEQINLPFAQGFFAFFFVVFLGAVFVLESGYGRPLFPPSLMASKSASLYIPVAPTKSKGFLPALFNRWLTAAVDIPSRFEKTNNVNGVSITQSIYRKNIENQEVNVQIFKYLNIYLYSRIVKNHNFSKIFENSFKNLDKPLRRGYCISMFKCLNT